jgi:uncharacterized protein (DUF952 family)
VRWLYHILRGELRFEHDAYAPSTLATDGFVHASHKTEVRESIRIHFRGADPASLRILQIDPRLLRVPVELATTPRGPMPHIQGAIPRTAVRGVITLDDLDTAPDDIESDT